jgi:hypothetical protein
VFSFQLGVSLKRAAILTYLLTPWSRVLLEVYKILSLETLPPGDPSGGVVYLRIVLLPEKASQLVGNS